MYNLGLFLFGSSLIGFFAWGFSRLGQSALTTWVALLGLVANIFVIKQINLFGFNATASDMFVIGSLLGLNLLQEKYGREAAKQAIWISFGVLLFFALVAFIHLQYTPSIYDQSQNAYQFIFGPSPRIMAASLISFFMVQQFDSFCYALCRKRFPRWPIPVSNGLILIFSQALDTVLFGMLGLYGLVEALPEILLVSYCIKLLAIVCTLPFTIKLFVKSC